jgi:hypothetical protein
MNRVRLRACAGIFAGLLACFAASCTRHDQDSTHSDFFPLHADDTWVYEVFRPLRNQRTRMTVRVRDERYVSALQRRCRLVDESYADDDAGVGIPGGGKPEVHPIAYYREKGFIYRALSLEYNGSELREIGLGSGEERFLPDGLAGDFAWDSITTAYDLGGGNSYDVRQNHRAILEPHVIEVPAGRFSGCVRVDTVALHSEQREGKYDSDPVVLYYSDWYAPNVGPVRTIQSNRPDGGGLLSQIELLAYDVESARR